MKPKDENDWAKQVGDAIHAKCDERIASLEVLIAAKDHALRPFAHIFETYSTDETNQIDPAYEEAAKALAFTPSWALAEQQAMRAVCEAAENVLKAAKDDGAPLNMITILALGALASAIEKLREVRDAERMG